MHLERIAIRNVFRHRRRSLLSGMALVTGVASAIFLGGFLDAILFGVIRGSVDGYTGALQIHRKGFLDATSNPLRFDMPSDLASKIINVPNVRAVAPRINFEGMLGNGSTSNVIIGLGVDAENEAKTCPRRVEIERDGLLQASDSTTINVGAELMKSMKLSKGSSVNVLGASVKGVQNALDATVKGGIDSPVPFTAKRVVTAPLKFTQTLLKMEGRVTEYAIAVHDLDAIETTRIAVQSAVGSDYEVITWAERDTNASNFAFRLQAIAIIVNAVMLILVLTFIVGTMLSSVYERVREIGTLLAFGMRRAQILRMFLLEAATLAFTCSLIGAALGAAVTAYFGHVGILIQAPGAKPTLLYPLLTTWTLAAPILFSTFGAVLAALLPAYRASRLRPTEALGAQ